MLQLQSVMQLCALSGVKVLVYGQAGSGKTRLCATAPNPVIFSAESGLLSLKEVIKSTGRDLPAIVIKNVADLHNTLNWLYSSQEAAQFQTVCLDSISEIAEVVLRDELQKTKDPRKAYGETNTIMMEIVRRFRDVPNKNVYMSSKMDAEKDERTGCLTLSPMMPGKTLGAQLPYMFDEVFYAYIMTAQDGRKHHVLRTRPDIGIEAKDRSGCLAEVEYPDLTAIFNKILKA